jgi:ZIP family zinc transporter
MQSLPLWAEAAIWGGLAGSGLLIGLLAAYIAKPGHHVIAKVMGFGAGALLSTASVQLTMSAQLHAGIARTAMFLLAGALAFSCVNAFLARRGATHRKRCGECVPQENEHDKPGSGVAIACGTIIDAIPEGIVIGVAVAQHAAPTIAVVVGLFLANVPESLSSSAGMHLAGRSMRFILVVWGAASLVTPAAAVLGSLLLANLSLEHAGALDAIAGGLLLAMAVESMIPEAFDKSPRFSGTIAAVGFTVIATIALLAP